MRRLIRTVVLTVTFFIAVVLSSVAALAQSYVDASEMSWRYDASPTQYIRLSNKPCTDPAILARIKPESQADFRQGVMVNGSDRLSICYDAVDMRDTVTILSARGVARVDMTIFTLESRT